MNASFRTTLIVMTGSLTALFVVRKLTRNQAPNPNLNPDPHNLPPTIAPTPPPTPEAPHWTPTPPAEAPPPPVVVLPRQMSDMSVEPGHNYRAVVTVHAPISWIANVDKVRREAEKQGFQNVDVQTHRPAGFPGNASGDYFVSASYGGNAQTMARSYASGQVSISDAWEV